MACVYIHKKLSNGEIFYVGVAARMDRPYSRHNRNKYWHNTVNKYGYTVHIVRDNLTYCCALTLEKILIGIYGRKDLNTGSLTNMTDGGEGTINISNETRLKISRAKKGISVSEETKIKISKSLTGRANTRGKFTHSNITKMHLSDKQCKSVVLLETGEIFKSILEASLKLGINKSSIGRSCRNKKSTKNLNFRFYERTGE